MLILGIDPGYATVGYGIVKYEASRFTPVDYGAVITKPSDKFGRRLEIIHDSFISLMKKYNIDALSIEKLYFNSNTTTAIDVAQARGVILLAAQKSGVPVFEYTPLQVKQAVTGYGRAEKKQMIEMTRVILRLDKPPKPDDTADALAMAVCHAHAAGSLLNKQILGEGYLK